MFIKEQLLPWRISTTRWTNQMSAHLFPRPFPFLPSGLTSRGHGGKDRGHTQAHSSKPVCLLSLLSSLCCQQVSAKNRLHLEEPVLCLLWKREFPRCELALSVHSASAPSRHLCTYQAPYSSPCHLHSVTPTQERLTAHGEQRQLILTCPADAARSREPAGSAVAVWPLGDSAWTPEGDGTLKA